MQRRDGRSCTPSGCSAISDEACGGSGTVVGNNALVADSSVACGPLSPANLTCVASTTTAQVRAEGTSATPGFPFFQKVLICNVLMVDSTADSMLFSYVGLLVAHLDPSFSRSSAGYASGLLLGLYQASQFVALPRWGRISDEVGRKPVLQASLLLCCAVSLLFGSSTTLAQALIARILHGCVVAGNITIKSYVTEITTEKTAAEAFSMVALARAVGGAVGPLVGGLLYDPTGTGSPLRSFFRGPAPPNSSLSLKDDGGSFWYHLFSSRPALLPSIVLSVYAVSVYLMVSAWLKESNTRAAKKRSAPLAMMIVAAAKAECLMMPVRFANGLRALAMLFKCMIGCRHGGKNARGPFASTNDNALRAAVLAGSVSGGLVHSGSCVDSFFDNTSIVSKASTLSALTSNTTSTTPRSMTPLITAATSLVLTPAVDENSVSGVIASDVKHVSPPSPSRSWSKRNTESIISAAGGRVIPNQANTQNEDAVQWDAGEKQRRPSGAQSTSHAALSVPQASPAEPTLLEQLTAANARLNEQSSISYDDVWSHPVLKILTPMYAALTSFNIWFMEIFPLYCIALRSDGGLGLGSAEVSVLLMMVAVANFIGNFLFPSILKQTSFMSLWRWGCVASALTIAFTPLVGTLTTEKTKFSYILALFLFPTVVRVFTTIWCFSMNTLFFANVAPKKHLGAVTSMSYASGAGARAIAPMIAAPIFAWSVSGSSSSPSGVSLGGAGASGGGHSKMFLGEYLSFVLCSGLAMVCLALSLRLDESVVGKRHA